MKQEDYELAARLEYERAIQSGLPEEVAAQLAADKMCELAGAEIRRILPNALGETLIQALSPGSGNRRGKPPLAENPE